MKLKQIFLISLLSTFCIPYTPINADGSIPTPAVQDSSNIFGKTILIAGIPAAVYSVLLVRNLVKFHSIEKMLQTSALHQKAKKGNFKFATWRAYDWGWGAFWPTGLQLLDEDIEVVKDAFEHDVRLGDRIYVYADQDRRIKPKEISAIDVQKAVTHELHELDEVLAWVANYTDAPEKIVHIYHGNGDDYDGGSELIRRGSRRVQHESNRSGWLQKICNKSKAVLNVMRKKVNYEITDEPDDEMFYEHEIVLSYVPQLMRKSDNELKQLYSQVKRACTVTATKWLIFTPSWNILRWRIAPCYATATKLYLNLLKRYVRLYALKTVADQMDFKPAKSNKVVKKLRALKRKVEEMIQHQPNMRRNERNKNAQINRLGRLQQKITALQREELIYDEKALLDHIRNIFDTINQDILGNAVTGLLNEANNHLDSLIQENS